MIIQNCWTSAQGWMIDSTRASNVWSSVALVAVRVMTAVTMYFFGTLFVLRLLFLVDNMEMTEIDVEYAASEHYLHAKCLVQVAHP